MATEVLTQKASRSRKGGFASRASRTFCDSLQTAQNSKGWPKSGPVAAVLSPRDGKTGRAVAQEGDWTLVLKTDRARPALEVRVPGSPVKRTTAIDALFQLGIQVHLLLLAEDVIGNPDDARRWFFETPQPVLGGATASKRALTARGAAEVEGVLHRIEQGVF